MVGGTGVRRGLAGFICLALLALTGCTHEYKTGYPWVVDSGAGIVSQLNGYAPDLDGWVFVLVPATYNPSFKTTVFSFGVADYLTLVPAGSQGWDGWAPDVAAMAVLDENQAFLDPSTTDTVKGTLVFQAPYDQLGSAKVHGYGYSAEGGQPSYSVDLGFDPLPARPAPVALPKLPTVPLGTAVNVYSLIGSDCQVTVTGTRLASRSGGIAPTASSFVVVDLSLTQTSSYQCSGMTQPSPYQLSAVAEPGRPQGVDSLAAAAAGISQSISYFFIGTVSETVIFDLDDLLYLVVTDDAGRQTRMDLGLDQAHHVDDIAIDQPSVPLGTRGETTSLGCTVLRNVNAPVQTSDVVVQIENLSSGTLYDPTQYLYVITPDGKLQSSSSQSDNLRGVRLGPGQSITGWLSFASAQSSQLVIWDGFTMVRMDLT